MSIVACKITGNRYEIAADSISVRGYTQRKGDGKFSKLFQVNGLVIGGVGAAKEVSLLSLFANTHKPETADERGIVSYLAEFAAWKKDLIDEPGVKNSYIIIYGGHAFSTIDWHVKEIGKYEAIGAGADFALAAMYLGHSAEEAVKTAIELSIYCEGPVKTIKGELECRTR